MSCSLPPGKNKHAVQRSGCGDSGLAVGTQGLEIEAVPAHLSKSLRGSSQARGKSTSGTPQFTMLLLQEYCDANDDVDVDEDDVDDDDDPCH